MHAPAPHDPDDQLDQLDQPAQPPGPSRLDRLGWDAARTRDLDAARASLPAGATAPQAGRVTRVDRGGADVATADGDVRVTFGPQVIAGMAEDRGSTPVVGDWVVVSTWPGDRRTLDVLLPRRTAVRRLGVDLTSHEQPLVANVDLVVVVEPLHPEPDTGRIERLLVLAWSSGAQPLVVLTKADLVPDAEHWRADVAAAAPGVDVLAGSAVTGAGLDPLAERLSPGQTVALLGPSGAGKSTLTNALAGATVMATRALRGDGKGRHTTTHRELVELPGGALLVDTPGLRSVGLVGDEEALATAFADVDAFAAACRFRDCAHHGEPGCAVAAAVESGELDERRYASWRKLQREVRHQERRADARLRSQEKARWKSVQKSLRRSGVVRP